MIKEIAKVDASEVAPAWMKSQPIAELGNLDISDYSPPRLKLIAATSGELETEPDARAGQFWLTGAKLNLGPEVVGVMIILNKSRVLWNPMRSESKVPLAIASDGIKWDPGYENQTFEVRFENNPRVYTWETKRSVAESGLDRFGSSRPEDRSSFPAASLTYSMIWALKLPGGGTSIAMVINSRSGVKPAGELYEMQKARGVNHFYQRYRICAVREKRKNSDSTYFTYRYFFKELVQDEEEGEAYHRLYDGYRKAGFGTRIAPVEDEHGEVVMRRTGPGSFRPAEENDVDKIPF